MSDSTTTIGQPQRPTSTSIIPNCPNPSYIKVKRRFLPLSSHRQTAVAPRNAGWSA